MRLLASRRLLETFAPSLVALLFALASVALLLLVSGYDVARAMGALVSGAFGSWHDWSETLVKSIPLALTGLAVALPFRTGVWNIGAEGQLLVGALVASAVAPGLAALPAALGLPLLLLSGVVAGGLWGGVAGWMRVRREVPEVVSTILLNFVAVELVRYAVQGPLMERAGQFPQSDALPASLRLARILPPARLHTGLLVVLLAAVLCHLVVYRTSLGFRMRAVAANAVAAGASGIDVGRARLTSLVLGGALAGVGGAVELSGVSHRIYQDFSPGYGYTAIAVALMGRLHPLAVIAAAVVFGGLENGALAMQRQANVSSVVVAVVQGIAVLTFGSAGAWRWNRRGG